VPGTIWSQRAIARKPPSPPPDPPADPPRPASPPRKRAPARAPLVAGRIPLTAPPKPGTPRKKAVAAGPSPLPPPARPPAAAERLDHLQRLIATSLEDDKADDIVTIDLAGRASFADRMVIATGLADRQIAAMASHLEEKLAQAGMKRVQVEGAAGSDWVLIDAGDIVIHLFRREARELYALERMWGSELDEAADSQSS
jgi:ribosome silencing factor RsfS/YbeB/iojap